MFFAVIAVGLTLVFVKDRFAARRPMVSTVPGLRSALA